MRPIIKFSIYIICLLAIILGTVDPVLANTNWKVYFYFEGPGEIPEPFKVRNEYMLSCLPKGSQVSTPLPEKAEGPFDVETPLVANRELEAKNVEIYLNSCKQKYQNIEDIEVQVSS